MIEQQLAQVILHALAHYARQINKRKYGSSLEDDDGAIEFGNTHQRCSIFHVDASIYDIFVQVREVGIGRGCQRDGDEKAQHPLPMRLEQLHNPLEHRAG